MTERELQAWSALADAEAPHARLGSTNWPMIVRSLVAEIRCLQRDAAGDLAFRRGDKAGLSWAAQIAFDQTTDAPPPGGWNAACEHISRRLSEEAVLRHER